MCQKVLLILVFVTPTLTSIVIGNVEKAREVDGKSSLVFVFDTTGSMHNDLEQLRDGAEMILSAALEEGNVIGDFVFVPFHDPVVGPATVTQDKSVFKHALEKVRVYGGGDCPEKSLGGVQLALNVSAPRSYVYVFTDATAGDHRLVGKVLDAVQRRQSQVVFVLTGHCNDLDKPSYKVYQEIAAASSGQVFNLNKTSVHKVLDFVKSSLKGRMVNLGSSVNPAGSNTQEIPVDSTLGEVTVSVSGASPHISVVDPSGARLTGPPRLVTTLDLAEIMVVKVMQPESGNWTITVGSAEGYSVKVAGLSNVSFEHGFSVEPPDALAETSYRPLKGTYNHMMIRLSDKAPNVTLDFAEIQSLNGSTLFELPLKEVGSLPNLYIAEAFIPPDEFFYIAINGRDEHDQPLRRIGTTAVQAKDPDVPYLTTTRKTSAHARSRVVLKCKVESLVPVVAMWTRGPHKLQPLVSSLQTTTIEYVIEDLKEEHVGTYKCVARNVAGVSRALNEVSLKVDPPQVSIEPANRTLEVGGNVTVTCTVLSEALLLDFQFISNLTEVKSTKINVDPNIEGIYTYSKPIESASEKDAGTYTCIARNKGGTANQTATILVHSKPTAQILGPHTISKLRYTVAQLICHVENAQVVKWMHKGDILKEILVNGSGNVILELNMTHDGVRTCVAEKEGFEASDSIEAIVLIKPSVTIAGDKNITIVNGTAHELICEVIAKPEPRVIWYRETEQLHNHTIPQSAPNTYVSRLLLNSSEDATYSCSGENSEGVQEDHVQVNVRKKLVMLKGFTDTSVELYKSVDLQCLVESPRLTTWFHNDTRLVPSENVHVSNDNTTVHIQVMDFEVLGMYSCVVTDGYEEIKLNGTLSVHGLESPVILKATGKIIAIKGKSTVIPCRVQKGSPEPTITWLHKGLNAEEFVMKSNGTSNLELVDATMESQGVYRCAAENIIGRDVYDVELILHYPPKLISLDPPNTNNTLVIEAGGTVTLSCEANGFPRPVVLWTKNQLPVKFSKHIYLKGDSLTIDELSEHDSGVYMCNATSSMGSENKNFTLVVYVAPKIRSPIEAAETPLEILEGQLVELPCEVEGVPEPVVTWKQNGLKIEGDRMFVDEFGLRFVANLTDFGNYTCSVINQYGNTSVTYSVYVWVPPSIQPPLEVNRDVLLGDNVSLQCDVVGFPIPSIRWMFNEVRLNENSTDISFNDVGNLYITNANSKQEGAYVCVAENLAGIESKIINLNVNESPKILEDNYTGPYLATNLDSALTITCRATGKPKPYIVWAKDNIYLHKDSQYEVGKDGTLALKNPLADMSGHYTCIAKNKFGSVNKTVAVEVYSLPTRFQAEETQTKTTVLEHADASLECPIRISDGDTVKWYKDAELISTGHLTIVNTTRNSQATYACVVSNVVGSAYATVYVDVEWPPNFADDGVTDKNLEETKLSESETNDEHAKILEDDKGNSVDIFENNLNVDIDSLNAGKVENVFIEPREINGKRDISKTDRKEKNIVETVKGDDTYLDCRTDAKPIAKIKWLHNSKPIIFQDKPVLKLVNMLKKDAGIYKCIASNRHGSIHKIFELNVSESPFISDFDMLDVSLMENDNASLECNATGYPEPNIRWIYNNTNWHLINSSLVATNITRNFEGVYRCEAANKAGSSHLAYRVSVLSNAKVEDIVAFTGGEGVTVEENFKVAVSTDLRIACKASGKPSPSVQWLRNGRVLNTNVRGVDYVDLVLQAQRSDTGAYSCIAANEARSDERTFRLEVLEPPIIIQSLFHNGTTLEVLEGQAFYLNCHPIGNPLPEVYWFKDGLPLRLFDDTMVSSEFGEVISARSAREEQAGNYTCIARNAVGNASVVYLVDVLVPPPQPKESSRPINIRMGKELMLSCPVEGYPLPNVMWIKHPYTEVGADTPRITLSEDNVTLLINRTQVSDSGNYSCIMTNKAGTTEVIYTVTIEKPPSIAGNVGPSGAEEHMVALRRSIVLKCEADGHPLPTINWLKDTQKLSDSSNVHRVLGNSLLAIWSVTSRDAAQYVCVAEGPAGAAHRRYNVRVQVPGKWSAWSEWSFCNVTCGLGQQQRSRSCQYIDDDNTIIDKTSKPDKIVIDESACKGPSTDKRKCQMPPCDEEGSGIWLPWSRWSGCSVSCGRGTQARTRRCGGKACEGDNVQIRKCPDLPKCNSNEDGSANDVYSKEDYENSYIPEAVFEKQPEIVNSIYSPEVEQFYISESPPSQTFYEVNVTSNLDGSDPGLCSPGYKPSDIDSSCKDMDECLLENNHCHATQVCGNTAGGYRCTCPRGYAALGPGQRCMDVNECSLGTAGCEFACVNTAGGYVCACPAHTRLHSDRHHCYTVSQLRRSNEEDTSEYLSASIEHPARYKHIRNV